VPSSVLVIVLLRYHGYREGSFSQHLHLLTLVLRLKPYRIGSGLNDHKGGIKTLLKAFHGLCTADSALVPLARLSPPAAMQCAQERCLMDSNTSTLR
jgi:hypothetical protein